MKIVLLILRILTAPFVFVAGCAIGLIVFGLGGCLGPVVAAYNAMKPISKYFTKEDKKREIKDGLMMFACCFIIPFVFTWAWITEARLYDL